MASNLDGKGELIAAAAAMSKEDYSNMMLLSFNGINIVIPYDAGIQIVASLKEGMYYYEGYSTCPPEVEALDSSRFTVQSIPARRVKLAKMAQLLKIPLCELDARFKKDSYDPPF